MSWSRTMKAALGRDDWVIPEWPAPANVRAFVTTRSGGVSEGAHATLNLGLHSGDDPGRVARNRRIVRERLPAAPRWMAQVHATAVADLGTADAGEVPEADAAVTGHPRVVGAVLTADCMPLFLATAGGERVGVVHAGWRGMAAGVIEAAVEKLGAAPSRAMAWMGPAIGPRAFEVGPEVREAFVAADPRAGEAFAPSGAAKYLADLYVLARMRLARAGVRAVYGGGFCTYGEADRFFSYRREKLSGRMGAFIWME